MGKENETSLAISPVLTLVEDDRVSFRIYNMDVES